MFHSGNLLSGKRKYLFGLIALSLICVICVAFNITGSDGLDLAKREVVLRRVGHELLLQSGDSTSRVLPVKKISENEYQVSFENELMFEPSFLVNSTKRLFAKDSLAGDYVVSVLDCGSNDVVYAYTISKNEKEDNVPCVGRTQPKACYTLNIKFSPATITTAQNRYLLAGLPFLAFVGLFFLKSAKPRRALPDSPPR